MPNFTMCAYDLQGLIARPGLGQTFTYTEATYGPPHELTVNDDDVWADSQSPFNENGANATYVSGSTDPNWNAGDTMDLNAVHSFSGSDGSTITLGWLNPTGGTTSDHQMMATGPFVEGVTYTEIPGSATGAVPGSTYEWSDFNFTHPTAPPCFTTGMEIRTLRGEIAVEDLAPGDMIWTLDNGFQELKFIGRREVVAAGSVVPVLFKKGAIGNTKDLLVSPKHRFHVDSLPADQKAHFGENSDTLLQAIAFCNGTTVRQVHEMKTVEYFQLMFDDHQLVECYGTISESFQPTANALDLVGEQAQELLEIFPEIGERRAFHPGSMVRNEVRLQGQPRLQ